MIIAPNTLEGKVKAPGSKSVTHRALVCAALAKGTSRIEGALLCDDTLATARCLSSLGAKFEKDFVDGTGTLEKGGTLQCQESGSTLRFLLPVACLSRQECTVMASGPLQNRPIQPLVDALRQMGANAEAQNGSLPVKTRPGLSGGTCALPGDVSSQFVSGLLFALPLCKKDSEITLTSPLQSKPYADLTVKTLRQFGVNVEENENNYQIAASQSYAPQNFKVEGDYSSAAFWLVAAAINGSITVGNLDPKSLQADKAIVSLLKRMGADVKQNGHEATAASSKLEGIEIDVSPFPDLMPILSVAGCFAKGTTRLYNASRLRIKESDRLHSMAVELRKMGAKVEERQDELVIRKSRLKGASLESHGDHRIAMSLTIAALNAEGKSELDSPDCVSKSYPAFFNELGKLVKKR